MGEYKTIYAQCGLDLKPCYTPCRFCKASKRKRCQFCQMVRLGEEDVVLFLPGHDMRPRQEAMLLAVSVS